MSQSKRSKPGVRDPRIPVEVVISRRRHVRGSVLNESAWAASRLLVGKGYKNAGQMCCLGFAARKAGLKASEIRGRTSYVTLDEVQRTKLAKLFPKLFRDDQWADLIVNHLHHDLTAINDDHDLTDKQCEERLTTKGLEAGIKFIFVP